MRKKVILISNKEKDSIEVNQIKRSVNFATSVKRKTSDIDNICLAVSKNSNENIEKIKVRISLQHQNTSENKTIKLTKGPMNQDQLKVGNIFTHGN